MSSVSIRLISFILKTYKSQFHRYTLFSDEKDGIDHLVFVVHGIGSVGDLKFRSFVDCGQYFLHRVSLFLMFLLSVTMI